MSVVFDWRDAPRAEFAVIGYPVKHSLSPAMHSAVYENLGLNYRYLALTIPPEEFSEGLAHLHSLGYLGLNVTVPHKAAAARWALLPDDSVRDLGVANTLSLQDGRATNTDAPGFLDTLTDLHLKPGRALVLGAGGTTRALLPGMLQIGWEVHLWNRTQSKAFELAEQVSGPIQVVDSLKTEGFSLILNTTSASLSGSELPLEWSPSTEKGVAYDLAYGNGPTPFLQVAESHGWETCDGRALLVAQGARSFEWWTGLTAPRDVMKAAVS